jgi:hypothetical protein
LLPGRPDFAVQVDHLILAFSHTAAERLYNHRSIDARAPAIMHVAKQIEVCLSHASCDQMKVGLPILTLLVEFAVHRAQYRDASDTSTEKLVPNPVDKDVRIEILECRFGVYPIFMYKRDQVLVRRGG